MTCAVRSGTSAVEIGAHDGPPQCHQRNHAAEHCQNMIEVVFPPSFAVSQERSDTHPAEDTAGVPPVIDPRKDQAEHEKTDYPAAHFAVNRTSIGSSSAFPIIKQGSDQAA